jgi:CheY-like chemotaxis protein
MCLPFMSTTQSNRKAILVVEDDLLVRGVLVELLIEEGFTVIEADSTTEALRLLESAPDEVRLIFTDIQMPGAIDGLGLVRLVRHRWPEISSIVSSGRIRPRQEDMPEEVRFIPKPWRAAEMLRHVNELLAA